MKMQRLLALRASAGSGKTFALVARYLSLMFLGVKPSEILAITFTNKAAGEMRERLIDALETLPLSMRDEVVRMSGLDAKELETNRHLLLKHFLSSELKVMTIDRFIHQILRKFCWYVGVQSDFEIASMPKEELFEHFLSGLDEKRYADLIDFARFERQKSSKFMDIFEILYEKDKELPATLFKIHPDNLPSCNEKDAMKWALKLKEFVQNGDFSPTAKKGMEFDTLNDVVAKSWFGRKTLDYRTFSRGYVPQMDIWLDNLYVQTAKYYNQKETFFLSRIFDLYHAYKLTKLSHLKRANQLYFKDIEHLVFELLRQSDFNDFLYFRLDSKIGHILFDEFQDTSVTQYRIFEPIMAEIASGEGDRTLFYVGDTKQSIYRFRGGQKELFDYVAKHFGVKEEYLDTNYRSKEAIVDFVNRTFDYVKPPQKAAKRGGYVEVANGDLLELLKKSLQKLFEAGIADDQIAILVHDNKEILQIGDFIAEQFGKTITTHKRAKVMAQPSARAIVSLMLMLHANNNGECFDLHRLNFLTLIGREYDSDFMPDIKIQKPSFMIKNIMDIYGLYDEAAMKLLEFSIGLHDLYEFAYEVERYDEELPTKEIGGINVLTVHKSKGLEFDHLIVMDRLGRSKSDTMPFIFDYDDISLKDIRMKFKNRDKIDPEFEKVAQKERRLKDEDRMNRVYVAFTRAKDSLTVLQKQKSSEFEFLNLNEQVVGVLKSSPVQPIAKKSVPPLKLKISDYGRQQVQAEIKSYKANDFEAIYLGLGVHYLLENEDEDAFMNRYGDLCDTKQALGLARSGMANMEYMILSEGKKVHELAYVYGGKKGVIDLYIDQKEKGIIIDYKTSTPHDISGYKAQLIRYKTALQRLQGKEMEAYIFFLDSQKLQKI